jgi:hypothetical protein
MPPALSGAAAIPVPVWITCAACGRRWTGRAPCHCSGCHQTFTGITAFDMHRTGSHVTGRWCADPGTVVSPTTGEHLLVAVTKQYWDGWGRPGEPPPRED